MSDQCKTPDDELIERPDGSFIPFGKLEPREQLAHDLTKKVVRYANNFSDLLLKFKTETIAELVAYRHMMLEEYSIKVGGKAGGITLRTADKKARVQLAISTTITFNEDLEAAKILIDECLEEWAETSGPEIREIITKVFKVNTKGRLDTQGILGLREHKFDHPKWTKAMEAIEAAICRDNQTSYLYFFHTDDNGVEHRISLDFANV